MKLTKLQKILILLKKRANSGGFLFRKHTAHASSMFIFKYIFHLLSLHDIYRDIYQFNFARRMGTPYQEQ
jgi:hypothetical protein